MKLTKLLFITSSLGMLSAQAATITFSSQTFRQTDDTVAMDTSWVSTSGSLIDATNVAGSDVTAGGVLFTGRSVSGVNTVPGGTYSQPSVTWSTNYASFFDESGSNAANALIDTGGYTGVGGATNGVGALEFHGLIDGQAYQVQMIFADSRSALDGRTVALSEATVSGTTVTNFGTGFNERYAFTDDTGDGNGVGFLVVNAEFTASGTTQAISINTLNMPGSTDAGSQLNAFQLRSIPEPSSAALLGLGGLALIFRRRK